MSLNNQMFGRAGAFPGMDQSFKTKQGYVTEISADADGVWAAVTLYDGKDTPVNARPILLYGGAGWGLYLPIEIDDHVIVAIPDGAPGSGCVILGTVWSKGDPPPAEVAAHPRDPLLFVREGASLRIVTSGAGNIILDSRGSGKVLLGAEEGTGAIALAANVEARLNRLETQTRYMCPSGGGPSSTAILMSAAFVNDPGVTRDDGAGPVLMSDLSPSEIPNAPHGLGAPGAPHYHFPMLVAAGDPEPTTISTPMGAGDGCAATKVEGV